MAPAPRGHVLARVLLPGAGRRSAGLGVVVGPDRVLTCAHVVNRVLGRILRSATMPSEVDTLYVDFPLLEEPAVPLLCWVDRWIPPGTQGVGEGDVASLRMRHERIPPTAGVARLSLDLTWARGEEVSVFGYPKQPPRPWTGAWSRCTFVDVVEGGLMQLDRVPGSAFRGQPGYSGSPVLLRDQVLGMFVAAPGDEAPDDTYAISASRLHQVLESPAGGGDAALGGTRKEREDERVAGVVLQFPGSRGTGARNEAADVTGSLEAASATMAREAVDLTTGALRHGSLRLRYAIELLEVQLGAATAEAVGLEGARAFSWEARRHDVVQEARRLRAALHVRSASVQSTELDAAVLSLAEHVQTLCAEA